MPRLYKSVSFWVFVAFVVLLALQVPPVPGIILMVLGAPAVGGPLVHVFLLSLLVEAIVGRVPRLLLLVPLAAYGGYYMAYGLQALEIERKSAELRASNPGKILDFDPASHSLVTTQAGQLVNQYEIPVAYEAKPALDPERYASFRLITRAQCQIAKDSQSRIQTYGVSAAGVFQPQLCQLEFPEVPPHKIVSVTRRGNEATSRQGGGEIVEQTIDVTVDGAVIGSYRTASTWRLPVLPLGMIGCFLNSGAQAWQCSAEFMRSPTKIDSMPDRVDRGRDDLPERVMLGLRKYTAADLANFRGYPENDAALARVAQEPRRVEDRVFALLQEIADGHNPKPPDNMNIGYALTLNPERLGPLAAAMAKRFVELNDPGPRNIPNRDAQWYVLRIAIPAVPRTAFPGIADQMFDLVRREPERRRMPALYVRAADAGMRTYPFYRDHFLGEANTGYLRTLPVLAICRLGQADEDVIAEMKRRFLDVDERKGDGFGHRSALAVALMKLGQETFVRENAHTVAAYERGWLDAVLAHKGETETGPNNCMPHEWTGGDFLSAVMAPSLKLRGNGWNT